MATTLDSLMLLAAARGSSELAVRVSAASDALREAIQVARPGRIARDQDALVAELRAELGEETFETAQRAGRAWDPDAAAASVLDS